MAEVTEQDPVKALFERRHEEWKEIVRRRHRFRPWKARRIIARCERLRAMVREMQEAFDERDRLWAEQERLTSERSWSSARAAPPLHPRSGERGAE